VSGDAKALDKAVADLTRAHELDSQDPEVLHDRATAYARLGRWARAIADQNRLVEMAPKSALAHNDLAWLLATCPQERLRDPKRAVELARKAVELEPKEGGYWNTLGAAQYRAGSWKGAVEALEKSMALSKGGDAIDWFLLAMAHWRLDRKDEARKWCERAVKWMEKNAAQNEELRRFRGEAEQVLGIKKNEP
jgi:Flp pilus assembly protein TadD